MWQYKRKDYFYDKGVKTNLEHGIKNTLFLQPTNTKAKMDVSKVCYFLMTEGLEKGKNQLKTRYREGWIKS